MMHPDETLEQEEEWERRDFGGEPGLASSYVDVRPQHFGPPRPRRYSRGGKHNRGVSSAGLSTKRTKKEVDSHTTQKGRTSTLPEGFVNGYYPNADFDYVRRERSRVRVGTPVAIRISTVAIRASGTTCAGTLSVHI